MVIVQQVADTDRLLGSLVLTEGNRLLFCPAAHIRVSAGDPASRFQDVVLEHVTLDPPIPGDRSRSHVATKGLPYKKSRGLKYETVPPSGHLIPWFSLLTRDMKEFPAMPHTLRVHFASPRPDIDNYANQLLGDGGVTTLPAPTATGHPSFLQFDFWAGRSGDWQSKLARPLAWAYKDDIAAGAPKNRQDIQVHKLDMALSATDGIRLLLSRPQGVLATERLLRPQLDS